MRAVVVCAWCHSFVAQLWAVFAVIGLEFMNKLCDGYLLCAGGWGLGEIEQELQARAAGKRCRQEMRARNADNQLQLACSRSQLRQKKIIVSLDGQGNSQLFLVSDPLCATLFVVNLGVRKAVAGEGRWRVK